MAELIAAVVWEQPGAGAEICRLERTDWGFRLAGRVLTVKEGVPTEIEYAVLVDGDWRTRSAEVGVDSGRIELSADGEGSWSTPDVDGCIDVDLGFSPCTNTLPIRRLELAVGEGADVDAAWVRWPELSLERLVQRYERVAADRYRYISGSFEADLVVDDEGLVVSYGDNWRTLARG